eukprot:scaffold25925_cov59-Attheya_sp.AAC.4
MAGWEYEFPWPNDNLSMRNLGRQVGIFRVEFYLLERLASKITTVGLGSREQKWKIHQTKQRTGFEVTFASWCTAAHALFRLGVGRQTIDRRVLSLSRGYCREATGTYIVLPTRRLSYIM